METHSKKASVPKTATVKKDGAAPFMDIATKDWMFADFLILLILNITTPPTTSSVMRVKRRRKNAGAKRGKNLDCI